MLVFYSNGIYFSWVAKIVFEENLDAKFLILFMFRSTKYCPNDEAVQCKRLQRSFGATFTNKLLTHKGWEKTIVENQNVPMLVFYIQT